MSGPPCIAMRPARETDFPALAALHAASFDYPWTAQQIAGLLGTSGAAALLALRGGEPVGFALWRCVSGEAELITIAVAPSARHRGIGARLLRAVARAAAREARELYLEVAIDNAAAARLYAAAGFDECGRREAYYRRPGGRSVDARLLKITLK